MINQPGCKWLFPALALLLSVPGVPAQQQEREGAQSQDDRQDQRKDWVSKVIRVQHADLTALERLLAIFRATVRADDRLRAIAVSAPPEIMPAIEDTIRQFDVPPSNAEKRGLELTVHILEASAAPGQAGTASFPADLKAVLDQLREVLAQKSFRLIDTLVLSATPRNNLISQGFLPALADGLQEKTNYTLRAMFEWRGEAALFQQFSFHFQVPVPTGGAGQFQYRQASIDTSLEVPPGKKVVVGKTAVADRSVILVLSMKPQ